MVTAAASGLAHAFARPPLYPLTFSYEKNILGLLESFIFRQLRKGFKHSGMSPLRLGHVPKYFSMPVRFQY